MLRVLLDTSDWSGSGLSTTTANTATALSSNGGSALSANDLIEGLIESFRHLDGILGVREVNNWWWIEPLGSAVWGKEVIESKPIAIGRAVDVDGKAGWLWDSSVESRVGFEEEWGCVLRARLKDVAIKVRPSKLVEARDDFFDE
jgi:hypothetical protein